MPAYEGIRPSSPIGSEDPLDLLLAACQRVKEENVVEIGETAESDSEVEENMTFTGATMSSDDSFLDRDDTDSEDNCTDDEEDDWEDEDAGNEEDSIMGPRTTWIDSGHTIHAKNKLIQIFAGDSLIPKQRWSLRKILATLLYHRKDEKLCSHFRQFRSFAYQTMMTESAKGGRWPGALMRKDCNLIIRLRFRAEMEKRYTQEVQKPCRTPGFALARNNRPGNVDRKPLETIVANAKETSPLLTSLVLSVGPTSRSTTTSHLVSMKLLAILVILCRSAHRNNSNYFPLLVATCLYFVGAKVDAITLLNYLGLMISYNVLLKKLRNITSSSAAYIKEQASNCRLVGSWDNFEYRENVAGERIGDTVKFRSVTMALCVKNGWRIPPTGLKQ